MRFRNNLKQSKHPKISSNLFLINWLADVEHILDSVLSNLDGMAYGMLFDDHWTMLYVSEGCAALTGYDPDEFLREDSIGYEQLTLEEDRERVRDLITLAVETHQAYDFEYRIRRRDGQTRWILERGAGIYCEEGKAQAIQGVILDITQHKLGEQYMLEAEQRYRHIFENSIEGIFQTTPQGRYLDANPALARIYGFDSVTDMIRDMNNIGSQLYVNAETRQQFEALMLEKEVISDFESQVYRRDGSIIWISENARAVRDNEGELLYYEGTVENITERKKNTALIEYQATHDELTGLPNRTLLKERLHNAIKMAASTQTKLAVIIVDLDHFKNINDSMGHHGGDQLLVAISRRLENCLRDTDTIARPGGDEFVLLISNIENTNVLDKTLRRVLKVTADPCKIGEREFIVTCSLGISLYPDHGHDSESLLRNADTAMYKAKQSGKNKFEFFTDELNALLTERLEIEYRMRNALTNQEFVLHYQPKISLASNQIVGMEALIRWHSTEYGFTSPAKFIPIAEQTHLIEQIGEWVIFQACEQCMQIYQATGRLIPVSVNVSARQFYHSALVSIVESALVKTGLDPANLEIEITEGTLIEKNSHVSKALGNLRALGIKLSIDDFGTGYSSLSYLKLFPIHHLKIDQSFVRGLEHDKANQAILKAIVVLAHNLNLEVIAEGVETESERHFLQSIDCDQMQGFLYSKPLAFENLVTFVCSQQYIT